MTPRKKIPCRTRESNSDTLPTKPNSSPKKAVDCKFIQQQSLCHKTACWFFLIFFLKFTPSLLEPVKCPGWKMHRRTSKQYIFWSYSNTSKQYIFWSYSNLFSTLCILMEILSHASAKMKAKRLTGFKFRRFYESFSNDIMAVKGLIGLKGKFLLKQHSFIFKHSKNRKKKCVLIISTLGICS